MCIRDSHNQAVMELGATVCTPKKPDCASCPLARKCIALATDRIAQLPVKSAKTKVRTRYFHYLHIAVKSGTYLHKRTGKDIWQGLYELPMLESAGALTRKQFQRSLHAELGVGWDAGTCVGPVKHLLSHQTIHITFWQVSPPKGKRMPKAWKLVKATELDKHALPRPIERYFAAQG